MRHWCHVGWIAWLVLGLAACSDSTPPDTEASSSVRVDIPARSERERRFDDRLAAIHQEWMGTPWTFTGTSQTPGQGSIACGYFVTTTLQQAGMTLDRVRLAQAASETMILAITPGDSIRRYSDTPLDSFLDSLRLQGDGYYVVGLDYHTGFLKVERDGTVAFIHSGERRGVVVESPEKAPELARSRYRVTGKLLPPDGDVASTGDSADS